MSVEEREILCYGYINALRDIERYTGMGLYGLDTRRQKLHNELCVFFGLTKEETFELTNNLDLNDSHVAEDLYIALLEKSRAKVK